MSYEEVPNSIAFSPKLLIQHTGEEISLAEEPLTIGQEDDNAVVLDDPNVSAHHASITWQAESNEYVIEDLASAEGTFVNERRVEEPQPLSHGDVIRVGSTITELKLEPEPEPPYTEAAMAAAAFAEPDAGEPADDAWRKYLLPTVAVAALVVITCACLVVFSSILMGGGDGAPDVTIVSPANGAEIVAGNDVILQAEARAAKDIVLLELAVDRVQVAAATSGDPDGVSSLSVIQQWTFYGLGEYTVSAVARTKSGKSSKVETVKVTVVPRGDEVRPTATPTSGPVEPTDTPETSATATDTPEASATATDTPEPEATLLPPPHIEYFQASPSSVTAGECTTLQWGKVSFATEAGIDPDVGKVGTPGSETVCPAETTTYVLTATGEGGTTTGSTTVTVIGGLPDLTIDAIEFDPNPAVQGGDTEVQIAIRNAGVGSAGAFDWEWEAGSEGSFDGRVYGLHAGETKVVSVLWRPEAAYPNLNTVALVDVNNEVPESDKDNNELSAVIQVVEAPAQPETVTLRSDGALDGLVINDGSSSTSQDIVAGNGDLDETTGEQVARGFMSFNLSDIPSSAVVESVELRFHQKKVQGDPYGKLGSLLLEHVNYGGTLDASAFDTPALDSAMLEKETGAGAWYVMTDDTIARWVEKALSGGESRFQLRLQFAQETDGDGDEDWIAVTPGGGILGSSNSPQLTITFLP
jgi:hypothetical protein